jgi:hypothetical protein
MKCRICSRIRLRIRKSIYRCTYTCKCKIELLSMCPSHLDRILIEYCSKVLFTDLIKPIDYIVKSTNSTLYLTLLLSESHKCVFFMIFLKIIIFKITLMIIETAIIITNLQYLFCIVQIKLQFNNIYFQTSAL